MEQLKTCLLVMAKMAFQDGVLDPREIAFLEEIATEAGEPSIDALIDEARQTPLVDLIARVDRYEDRFFIALRAYMMAQVDHDFDVEEEAFFERLVKQLGIFKQDRRLIERAGAQVEAATDDEPEPRMLELYRASSFFMGD